MDLSKWTIPSITEYIRILEVRRRNISMKHGIDPDCMIYESDHARLLVDMIDFRVEHCMIQVQDMNRRRIADGNVMMLMAGRANYVDAKQGGAS